MLHDWSIHARAAQCALSGRAFADGETFYALLYRDKHTAGLHRVDVCAEAWRELQAKPGAAPPFSFWRSKFIPPPPPDRPPETLPKEDAETLLRGFLGEGGDLPAPEHERVCYLLVLMLERKRRLRPVDAREEPGTGRRLLFYEHVKTGESFVLVDPELRLEQLEAVQREVSALLSPPPAAEVPASPDAGTGLG